MLDLDFDTDWASESSDARKVFNSLMSAAIAPMYGGVPKFLGVNILSASNASADSLGARKRREITRYGMCRFNDTRLIYMHASFLKRQHPVVMTAEHVVLSRICFREGSCGCSLIAVADI